MKILSLHCDYIKFKAVKKALKEPEKLSEADKKEKQIKEVLVIFTAVEKGDKTATELVKNIEDIAKQVKTKNIVLYPYAHLSSQLSSPDTAVNILKQAEAKLKKKLSVTRAPFGYYKQFELKCKGHPLAELSREITETGETKEAKYDYKQLLREISKTRLDRLKLKENDHRILGQQMDLFSFNETAPGMVFWHNNGLIIKNELIKFWREEHQKEGYEEISTPQIMDKKLWQVSGHWEKYSENNFVTEYEKRPFLIKPMNCPGGMLVYKTRPRSYKELPMKVGELGVVHRQELSGVLAGLFRVIQFTQDDAHIFCTEEQIEPEIIKVMKLVDKFYKKFKLPYQIELSTRPKKRIGSDKMWDKAEKALGNVLKKQKVKFKLNKGEGAFYGPKIDFHVKDSLGRTWQCATIQLDFSLPERFDLTYIGEDNKRNRVTMLHRVIYGAIERFIGILLEHTKGHLPTWLTPVQAKVISFTNRNKKTAEKILNQLKEAGIRAESDFEDKTINNKVREAELQKIPYIITIGDKEEKNKTITVRKNSKTKFGVKVEKFIKDIKQEIEERK